jgi:hypothetical protein
MLRRKVHCSQRPWGMAAILWARVFPQELYPARGKGVPQLRGSLYGWQNFDREDRRRPPRLLLKKMRE